AASRIVSTRSIAHSYLPVRALRRRRTSRRCTSLTRSTTSAPVGRRCRPPPHAHVRPMWAAVRALPPEGRQQSRACVQPPSGAASAIAGCRPPRADWADAPIPPNRPMPCFRLPARQRGAAMLEFTAAALPVLLAGAAALEAARWYAVRQALSLALHEAARAAAVAHAEPRTLHQAFERALRPLFVPPGPHAGAPARMQAEAARPLARTGLPPWPAEVLGPPASASSDFGRGWPGSACRARL